MLTKRHNSAAVHVVVIQLLNLNVSLKSVTLTAPRNNYCSSKNDMSGMNVTHYGLVRTQQS